MVGHKHAVVPLPPSRATSAAVRWVACTARRRGAEQALGGEQAGGGEAVRREAGGVLGGLLGEVHVQGPGRGVHPFGDGSARTCAEARHPHGTRGDRTRRCLRDDVQRRPGHRPHGVHGHADP